MPLRPFAAVDPRRIDNPDTGGINTVTGQALKTLTQTQATSPDVPPGVNNGQQDDSQEATTAIDPGVGAADDGTTAGIQDVIVSQQNAVSTTSGTVTADRGYVIPKPNILDKFASYTYRASVYLLTPEQWSQLSTSKKKNVRGFQLLFQSGGAPNNSGGVAGGVTPTNDTQNSISTQADAGRNPAFPVDYYIDTITLVTKAPGPGSRGAHGASRLSFTVVEPANISLIDRIVEAVKNVMPNGNQKVNYSAPTYLMVLRWYGYDINGKLIPGITGSDSTLVPSDTNAVIEKFIPFRIKTINWSVKGSLVTYTFEAAPLGLDIAAGTRRGSIPYDIELTAENLGKLLGGELNYSTATAPAATPGATTTPNAATPATQADVRAIDNAIAAGNQPPLSPPKANAAPSKTTITAGLMEAMNKFQQELVKQQKYEVPDTYRVTFVKGPEGAPLIENATIVPPGKNVEKKLTPMSKPATSNASSLDPAKSSVNDRAKNFTVTAGQQLIQVLDLAIRNSTYILDQALTIEVDDQPVLNPEKLGATVYWYNIVMNATPKLPYDNLRNDFAYDIEFVITPYVLQDFNSKFFPLTKFKGVHKSYEYWFTGKNTAVLEYQESLNNNYNITISGANPKSSKTEKQRRALEGSMREQPFYNFQSGSTETRQGSDGKDYEPSANAAEYLYDPKGMSNCKMKIIGDPAWIPQGSLSGSVDANNFSFSPFLADGTINYDSMQVMFEIAWQRPEDYDLTTGLADPYQKSNNKKRQPVQSRVYTTTTITSEFSKGLFTQNLEGRLYNFPTTQPNNKSVGASLPNTGTNAGFGAGINAGFGAGVSEFGEDARETPTASSATETTQTGRFDTNTASASGTGVDTALTPAPVTQNNLPKTESTDTPSVPIVPNSGARPESPPRPITSNGVVAGIRNLFTPPKLEQADIRAIDNAIAAGQNRAAFGQFRPPRPRTPQIIARDDQ